MGRCRAGGEHAGCVCCSPRQPRQLVVTGSRVGGEGLVEHRPAGVGVVVGAVGRSADDHGHPLAVQSVDGGLPGHEPARHRGDDQDQVEGPEPVVGGDQLVAVVDVQQHAVEAGRRQRHQRQVAQYLADGHRGAAGGVLGGRLDGHEERGQPGDDAQAEADVARALGAGQLDAGDDRDGGADHQAEAHGHLLAGEGDERPREEHHRRGECQAMCPVEDVIHRVLASELAEPLLEGLVPQRAHLLLVGGDSRRSAKVIYIIQ